MNRLLLTTSLLLALAGPAAAERQVSVTGQVQVGTVLDHRDRDRHDRNEDRRYARYDSHERWRHSRDRRDEHHDARYWAYHRYRAPDRYLPPRGYSIRAWEVGHRLPPAFFESRYYLSGGYYGLARPPYGHRWIRVGNDVYLVSLRSGLIVDVRFGLFY